MCMNAMNPDIWNVFFFFLSNLLIKLLSLQLCCVGCCNSNESFSVLIFFISFSFLFLLEARIVKPSLLWWQLQLAHAIILIIMCVLLLSFAECKCYPHSFFPLLRPFNCCHRFLFDILSWLMALHFIVAVLSFALAFITYPVLVGRCNANDDNCYYCNDGVIVADVIAYVLPRKKKTILF